MDAIKSDADGKAEIDYDKCVSRGMCLVNCPFGAIVDKGQIFQTIYAMKEGYDVIANLLPLLSLVNLVRRNARQSKSKD